MVWSDKSISTAVETYTSAVNEGVPDWYAMKLALDVAFEENGGVVKLDKNKKDYSSICLAVISGISVALGIVILTILLYSIKG